MLTMQVFYNHLFTASGESPRTPVHPLEQLTRASLAQIRAAGSDLVWEAWHAEQA